MDRARNPFSPGAGTPPPELAGRSGILEDAMVALKRVKNGRAEKSMILVGLRGVGKTVLLGEIQHLAEAEGYKVTFIEAHESRQKKTLPELLMPHLRRILFDLNRGDNVSEKAKKALRVFKSFISALKIKAGDMEFSIDIDAETGEADSGDLEVDLATLFVAIGEAAKDRATAVAIIIDELQYLDEKELSAMIMAVHRVSQRSLPLILIGAGLPQLVGKAGNSKSYAERLFSYPIVGALAKEDARIALQAPVKELGVNFSLDALDEIYNITKGYPYFLQEWGYHAWNIAANDSSIISVDDAKNASQLSIANLDKNFFRVRFDRLTPNERKYVRALAELGRKPQRSGDIANKLGKAVEQVAPLRAQLINKGMIYSPAHGDIAFTVPLFEEFLMREIPVFSAKDTY
ncbi:MAG: ATP-binding protein [Gammaproteobacteria bacterium]|nr:ATP-binding protein [Gammaproteobacteria bacterium]